MLALVPHIGDYATNPVNHLAHAEVLLEQRIFMVRLDQLQFDYQSLILLLFEVLKCMQLHSIQLALKNQIQGDHLQPVLLQSTLHLTIDPISVAQEVVGCNFKMHRLATFSQEEAE